MTRLRACVAAIFGLVAFGLPVPAHGMVVPPPVPRAECAPGDVAEANQGRTTAADMETGKACNLRLLGHAGTLGGFRTHRIVDAQGRECGFFDVTSLLPTRSNNSYLDPNLTGTFVVDMSDPAAPAIVNRLVTPAMLSPHESLSLHAGRGLLAANAGNLTTKPGFVDIYDVRTDCRNPRLLSSVPVGVAGHEGSFSPDGRTYWVAQPVGFFAGRSFGGITAVDVSDPLVPRTLWSSPLYTSHGLNLSPDGKTLYFADMSATPGLTILDVTDVQERVALPTVRTLSHITWDTVSIPQTPIPVTIGGRPYLVEVDEFTSNTLQAFTTGGSFSDPSAGVGAARIIDVADPRNPRIVSDIRLEVHQPEARAGEQAGDPGANTALGYAAHYCAVPSSTDPGIVACSFLISGLRVFDISDPLQPREIAYYDPPVTGGVPNAAASGPAFVPERDEIWYTDGNHGFYALRLAEGVWPR